MLTKQNRTGVMFVLFALICGLAAGGIVFLIGVKVSPSVPALVAVQEIQAGDPLNSNMFKEIKLPKAGLPDGVIRPEANINTFIAKHGMAEGDVLREQGIVDTKNSDTPILSARLSVLSDPALRAVEIPADAAAGMLAGMKAGDRVDIVSVFKTADSFISKTIIEDVQVIGVNAPGESQGVLIAAMTKEQAETFFLAEGQGKVYASLRPFGKGGNF